MDCVSRGERCGRAMENRDAKELVSEKDIMSEQAVTKVLTGVFGGWI